ncbi:hypothetical protein FHG89_13905 [Micromonospora orduensis]|uniref:GNAT family N-acetyltransferase n=1 Tax=Micromonospora orduensis TaxID=1420891 RepID=A0A5C4QPF6_9ACTN|nr:hypothetical protein [Micromonospora orduensis]TNH28925.1 hypothetical protein FHG89_13905 [Micromonospora orduensis]
MDGVEVRAAGPAERTAIDALHEREWGGPYVVAHDTGHDVRTLPTLVALSLVGEHGIPLHDELVLELRTDAEG